MGKKIILGLAAAVLLFIGAGLIWGEDTTQTNTANEQPQTTDMSPIANDLDGEVQKAISRQSSDNVVVLDVRTDAEWNEQHAEGAVHWNVEKIKAGQMPPIAKDKEIYVYCRTGNRAQQAIAIMQENGFEDLTNIRGMTDWVAAGGPTESGI